MGTDDDVYRKLADQRARAHEEYLQRVSAICQALGQEWRICNDQMDGGVTFAIWNGDDLHRLLVQFKEDELRIELRSWPPGDLFACLERGERWPRITVAWDADPDVVAKNARGRLFPFHDRAIAQASFWAAKHVDRRNAAERHIESLTSQWPWGIQERRGQPSSIGTMAAVFSKSIYPGRTGPSPETPCASTSWTATSDGRTVELQFHAVPAEIAQHLMREYVSRLTDRLADALTSSKKNATP